MAAEQHWVTGIGYQGESVEGFVAKLSAWHIGTVVDVRLNAISRKRGFAKKALEEALRAKQITYLHRPSLGNAKDNRDGYAEMDTAMGDAARDAFRERLNSGEASGAIDEIVELTLNGRVAVLCFEESELHCHRKQVLDEVRGRLSSLVTA